MPLHGEYEPSPTDFVRDQVALYEATDGVEGGTFKDRPVVVMTHKGAKSGKIRKNPLMKIEHDGTYAVVASNGGGALPVWYQNLVVNPVVELQDGSVKQDMRAREIFGEEKLQWWDRADEAYPDFIQYRVTAGRDIPLFVLESIQA
ncbi:nitroreductase family deazaflavin-dependent oxidoreductase [Dactylosporangium darangshiense]|uniref:Nitroreductase family deazaflavin-dependent oxidoreductase n=2 Tax=Dactylosporangium darangshiense TaxID=579108 RepID=A0ABP8DW91_9ACTN